MAASRFYLLVFSVLCAIVAAGIYVPGLRGGFILDDIPAIRHNWSLQQFTEFSLDGALLAAYSFLPGDGSRPLAMFSFAVDHWRAGGMDPQVFKATNLSIHALTTFALTFFFRQLLVLTNWPVRRAAWIALALAAFWAVHPLQVSSVLYVVQRMQTLCTLFVVLALWAYLVARQAQIEGRSGRTHLGLVGLFGLLAYASKEDAVLLPAYLLVLELTVLRFRAAQPALAAWLRRGFLFGALVGLIAYFALVIPHYWSWGNYPGRDFTSVERLLTQGRVLMMYIGQILLPLPERMTFFYDHLPISRSVLEPASTLFALMGVSALLVWAWCWRQRRPVFACGVLLFFAGHFMTSNVINLELVFEHRNHFPMIGAVLAVGDLVAGAIQRWRVGFSAAAALVAIVLAGTTTATVARAHAWGEPLRLAQYLVEIAPQSERAWLTLGGAYADLSGLQPDSPYLQKAIETCELGAQRIDSALLLANIVNYKTVRGDVTEQDWARLHDSLGRVTITVQSRMAVWTAIRNAQRGIPMDERGVLKMIEIISSRAGFRSDEYLRLAAYVFNDTVYPDEAFRYLKRAVLLAAPNDPLVADTLAKWAAAGRENWVDQLTALRDSGEGAP